MLLDSFGEPRCTNCGGRGWKFVGLRRSLDRSGDAGERSILQRARTTCLACLGHGSVPAARPAAPATRESD